VEWDVTLPPGALLTFSARHAGPGGDGALVSVKVSGTLKPEVLWERELLPGSAAVPAALDLNRWAGSRIRIRFDISPGASRDAGGDLVELERPLLEAGGTHASLMETANWWQARCGYRPLEGPGPLRDVLTGPSGPSFDPDALTTALDRARRESLRPVLVDAHPTGSLDTASPAAFGMFWARVLQAKTAAVIFDDAAGGLEAMASELARWRNWMHLRPVAAGSPVQAPVAGAAVIVRSEVTAREEGLYCVEERGLLRVPDRLAAFHVSDRTPVSGFTDRHGLVVVFPAARSPGAGHRRLLPGAAGAAGKGTGDHAALPAGACRNGGQSVPDRVLDSGCAASRSEGGERLGGRGARRQLLRGRVLPGRAVRPEDPRGRRAQGPG
jgi:hypothetical protein